MLVHMQESRIFLYTFLMANLTVLPQFLRRCGPELAGVFFRQPHQHAFQTPSRPFRLSPFDRDEAQRFVGPPQRLPGPEDIARDPSPGIPPLSDRNPSEPARSRRASTCPAILGHGRPGRLLAGALPRPPEEDDEGAAQSADGRVDKGHDGGVGRLRPAHVRPPPAGQRLAAQDGRGHDQGAAAWREIPAVQEGCLQRWRVRQRQRGENAPPPDSAGGAIALTGVGVQIRMGKGKGSFDHWAARIAINQILFEIRGQVHEQVIRDAFRLAGNKLPGTSVPALSRGADADCFPGQYEFVRKGDAPMVGITKLSEGVTLEDLKRPWKKLAAAEAPAVSPSADAAPGSAPPPS